MDDELPTLSLGPDLVVAAALTLNRAMSDGPSATGAAALEEVEEDEEDEDAGACSPSFSNTDPSVSATLVSLFHSDVMGLARCAAAAAAAAGAEAASYTL